MTAIAIAQNKRVLVVIDIAKARHEVLIAVAGKKHRRCRTVLNKFADVTRLIAALKDYSHPVRAAFEAAGHYHRALAYHLVTTGFEVKLVTSVVLACAREALHIRWDNNDPKDAQVILHMMEFWMSRSIMARFCPDK
jgi:transposase